MLKSGIGRYFGAQGRHFGNLQGGATEVHYATGTKASVWTNLGTPPIGQGPQLFLVFLETIFDKLVKRLAF